MPFLSLRVFSDPKLACVDVLHEVDPTDDGSPQILQKIFISKSGQGFSLIV